MSKTVVIDYGASNTLSVVRALEYLGQPVTLTSDFSIIKSAKYLLLPGVGAFPDAMEKLTETGLDQVIRRHIQNGKPIFGICLGMQLLFTKGFEFTCVDGLDCIGGNVVRIPNENNKGEIIRVPNIGWRNVTASSNKNIWNGTPLQNMKGNESLYFAHSYKVIPDNPNHVLAYCDYEGYKIPAAIKFQNIFGCQFHPEKSGPIGLDILKTFLSA